MRSLFVRVYGSRSRDSFIDSDTELDYLRYTRILVNSYNRRIKTFLLKFKKIR